MINDSEWPPGGDIAEQMQRLEANSSTSHSFCSELQFTFFFLNILLVLIIWEFHIMNPYHTNFPVLSGPSYPWLSTPSQPPRRTGEMNEYRGRGRERGSKSPICVAHTLPEHGQTTSALKKIILLYPHPCHRLSIVEGYISASLPQFLRFFFDGFLSRLLHFGRGNRKVEVITDTFSLLFPQL